MLDRNGVLLLASCGALPEEKGLFLSGTLILDQTIYDGEGWVDQVHVKNGSIKAVAAKGCGRYLLLNSNSDKVQVAIDDSGSEPLFLYRSSSGWVVSNSLYSIVELVKTKKWPLTLHEDSLASVFIDHSIGRTLFSPQTIYEEITLVPLDKGLEVCRESGACQTISISDNERLSGDYQELLMSWFARWRGVLSAIASRSAAQPLLLDLSGGVDSRMVLSLMLSGINDSGLKVHTQKNSLRDAEVARSLGSRFGFEVGHNAPSRSDISVNEQFEKYLVGNLNFYHMPVKPALAVEPRDIFKVNGIGGEVIRDFYPGTGQDWISKVPRILPVPLKRYRKGVRGLLEDAFMTFGVNPRSPTSMREHYRQLRSRIHGGRRLHERFKYKFLSPLLDRAFQKLSDVDKAPSPEEIYRDILIFGGGVALARHPFDHGRKNFSAAFCRKSMFYRPDERPCCDGSVEKFTYEEIKGESAPYRLGGCTSAVEPRNCTSLQERISQEYANLLEQRCDQALPSGFRELLHSKSDSEGGKRQKEMREVVGFSAITACLNTSQSNDKG